MITYIIKSSICLTLLLLFYLFVLEREKMHQFNRFYLLGSVLFSFLAPLYSINIIMPVETTLTPVTLNETLIDTTNAIQNNTTNYWNIIILISICVSVLFFIRFGVNLFKIFSKIRNNTKIKIEKAVLVLVNDEISPHTFWNYIFINKQDYESQNIEKELLTHELTHVTQKHTLDVLFIELLKIIFWFNPLFYVLKKFIQLNHEFIADNKVIHLHKNISEYQHLLLNRAAWNNDYYLASNLNYSLTKKRLVMMSTKTSKVNGWLRKIAVIPLLMGSIYVFAERVETIETESKNLLDSEITKTDFPKKEKITPVNLKEIKKHLKNENALKSSIENNKTKSEFLASIERDGNEVKLKCYNCKRWAKLKIPLNKEFTITDWGFTNSNNISRGKYAFTIKVTDKDVFFKGIKNTAWKTLGFTLLNNKKQYINQNGMIAHEENSNKKNEEGLKNVSDLTNYQKLNSTYESLRNVKPHYVKSNIKRQKKLDDLFSKLGSMYFRLSKENKKKAKRPIHPFNPYLKLKKNNNVFYKLRSELTEEDKLLIPPPPPPPNASKEQIKRAEKAYKEWKKRTRNNSSSKKPYPIKIEVQEKQKKGYVVVNNQTLYYVINKKGTTYYNRWGQEVDKTGKIINPEKKFPVIRKGDSTNIPPPPPPPINPILFSDKNKDADFYYNDKKVSYKEIKTLIRDKKDLKVSTKKINGKKIIRFTVKQENKKQVSIDKINNLSNKEILALPRSEDINEPHLYLNGKAINKEQYLKIDKQTIEKVHVNKDEGKNGAVYITTK